MENMRRLPSVLLILGFPEKCLKVKVYMDNREALKAVYFVK